ncbi:MAG: 7-cyano-7-deazaguanine synthase QueC [Parachlamydiaceae bacterium]
MTKAVVIHSGGMDSSICLGLAIREFGANEVISLSFSYSQRHSTELERSKKIASDWRVRHFTIALDLSQITANALMDPSMPIVQKNGTPNTLVLGRNGLMARLGAIFAHEQGAHIIYMGVMELESANSGYRDCSRAYMDLKQTILRMDLNDPVFEIRTPLVHLTKKESMVIAYQLGVLPYLLQQTISCYEGVDQLGCQQCPACKLRNQGLRQFQEEFPEVKLPYKISF